jgi:hypothetical protein
MPQARQATEDLRILYRALGVSEETLTRAIQYTEARSDAPTMPELPKIKQRRGRPRQNVRRLGQAEPTGQPKRKRSAIIATLLIGSLGFAVAQNQVPPGNKSEAATPAPPAQQNAPPDKIAPGRLPSPNAVPPEDKAEGNSPALKLDSGEDKKSPTAK